MIDSGHTVIVGNGAGHIVWSARLDHQERIERTLLGTLVKLEVENVWRLDWHVWVSHTTCTLHDLTRLTNGLMSLLEVRTWSATVANLPDGWSTGGSVTGDVTLIEPMIARLERMKAAYEG